MMPIREIKYIKIERRCKVPEIAQIIDELFSEYITDNEVFVSLEVKEDVVIAGSDSIFKICFHYIQKHYRR